MKRLSAPLRPTRTASSYPTGGRGRRSARTLTERLAVALAVAALLPSTGISPSAPGPTALAAQVPDVRETGAVLEALPAGTRALGLGGAFHGGLRESDAVFASPGHLTSPAGMEAAFQQWGDRGSLVQLSAGTDWWSGGVAIGVRAISYGPALRGGGSPALNEEGGTAAPPPGGQGSAWILDDASELHLAVGYGRVIRGFRMGAVGSVLEFRNGGRSETTGAASVGAARALGPITVSAALLNLGGAFDPPPIAGDIDLPGSHTPLALTREIALGGASQTVPLGPIDLGGAARVAYHEGGSLSFGGGVEVSYWPIQGRTFTLRLGARRPHDDSNLRRWTAGAAFRGDRLGLDYAPMASRDGSISHRIGLNFR